MAIRRARLKTSRRSISTSPPCVLRAKAKPGLGSRPACTRSASEMPSSWNVACSPRLLSSATCTASSTTAAAPAARVTRWSMVSRSASDPRPAQVLAEALLGGLLDRRKAAVRTEGGAAAEEGGGRQHGRQAQRGRRNGSVLLDSVMAGLMGFCARRGLAAWASAGGCPCRLHRVWAKSAHPCRMASPRAVAPRGRRRASHRCVQPRRWPRARTRACRRSGRGSARTTSGRSARERWPWRRAGSGRAWPDVGRRRAGALCLRGEGGCAKRGPHEPAQKSFGHGVLA